MLQAIRLKGRATGTEIASTIGVDEAALLPTLRAVVDAEWCTGARGRYRVTPAGLERLTRLIAEERADMDRTALAAAYDQFVGYNTAFKRIVTDWQLVAGLAANDHTDAAYDAQVIGRLDELHDGFRALLAQIVDVAPRLAPYPRRLASALAKVQAGDPGWLARPLIDSYHTVWFELHEDLIGLAGLVRADEAAEGRAE